MSPEVQPEFKKTLFITTCQLCNLNFLPHSSLDLCQKLLMLTLMQRGKKKTARMSEEEYMLQGLLWAQENRMALWEMADIFHPQLQE